MSHKIIFINKKQQGFLIPVALFIVLLMGIFALTMSQLTSGARNSAVLEALSNQVFYAAESGAQYAMYTLFFDVTSRATADTNCSTVNGMSDLALSASGLTGCTVDLGCSVTNDGTGTRSIYAITAAGSCGSGELTAERTLSVQAFMAD